MGTRVQPPTSLPIPVGASWVTHIWLTWKSLSFLIKNFSILSSLSCICACQFMHADVHVCACAFSRHANSVCVCEGVSVHALLLHGWGRVHTQEATGEGFSWIGPFALSPLDWGKGLRYSNASYCLEDSGETCSPYTAAHSMCTGNMGSYPLSSISK